MVWRHRRLRRNPLAALLLLLLAMGLHGCQQLGEQYVYAGAPRADSWGTRLSTHHLVNPGFAVGYSEWLAVPLWVGYVARDPAGGTLHERPEHFAIDPRTLRRVDGDDYRGSGYDRGHMAPNYLISRVYGVDAQRASFRMSNIVPQLPRHNQLVWQRMEELEADALAPRYGQIWVLVGPIFGDEPHHLESGVAVPEALFRVWLREDPDGTPQAAAFIVPQAVCGFEPLRDFSVAVATVEKRTGLDLFAALPDELERRIASSTHLDEWPEVADAPTTARYGERWRGQACPYR